MTNVTIAWQQSVRPRLVVRFLAACPVLLVCAAAADVALSSTGEGRNVDAMATQPPQPTSASVTNTAYDHPYGYAPLRRFDRN